MPQIRLYPRTKQEELILKTNSFTPLAYTKYSHQLIDAHMLSHYSRIANAKSMLDTNTPISAKKCIKSKHKYIHTPTSNSSKSLDTRSSTIDFSRSNVKDAISHPKIFYCVTKTGKQTLARIERDERFKQNYNNNSNTTQKIPWRMPTRSNSSKNSPNFPSLTESVCASQTIISDPKSLHKVPKRYRHIQSKVKEKLDKAINSGKYKISRVEEVAITPSIYYENDDNKSDYSSDLDHTELEIYDHMKRALESTNTLYIDESIVKFDDDTSGKISLTDLITSQSSEKLALSEKSITLNKERFGASVQSVDNTMEGFTQNVQPVDFATTNKVSMSELSADYNVTSLQENEHPVDRYIEGYPSTDHYKENISLEHLESHHFTNDLNGTQEQLLFHEIVNYPQSEQSEDIPSEQCEKHQVEQILEKSLTYQQIEKSSLSNQSRCKSGISSIDEQSVDLNIEPFQGSELPDKQSMEKVLSSEESANQNVEINSFDEQLDYIHDTVTLTESDHSTEQLANTYEIEKNYIQSELNDNSLSEVPESSSPSEQLADTLKCEQIEKLNLNEQTHDIKKNLQNEQPEKLSLSKQLDDTSNLKENLYSIDTNSSSELFANTNDLKESFAKSEQLEEFSLSTDLAESCNIGEFTLSDQSERFSLFEEVEDINHLENKKELSDDKNIETLAQAEQLQRNSLDEPSFNNHNSEMIISSKKFSESTRPTEKLPYLLRNNSIKSCTYPACNTISSDFEVTQEELAIYSSNSTHSLTNKSVNSLHNPTSTNQNSQLDFQNKSTVIETSLDKESTDPTASLEYLKLKSQISEDCLRLNICTEPGIRKVCARHVRRTDLDRTLVDKIVKNLLIELGFKS